MATNAELKVGDVVRLNSGGPLMTVGEISENSIFCCYMDVNTNTHRKIFSGVLDDHQ